MQPREQGLAVAAPSASDARPPGLLDRWLRRRAAVRQRTSTRPGIIEKLARRLRFIVQFREFRRLADRSGRLPARWSDRQAHLYDDSADTAFDRHYILHTAWAARVLASTRPALHVDIGSSLYFSTQVSAFVPIDAYDFRPARISLSGFTSKRADLAGLPFPDRSVASLSCMHTVEHIGLGRYGDALGGDADFVALGELSRVLAAGGDLLLVVPIGRPRIVFNAHRVYSHRQILDALPQLDLHEFTLIPDRSEDGDLVRDPPLGMVEAQAYGCGCFWFKRAR